MNDILNANICEITDNTKKSTSNSNKNLKIIEIKGFKKLGNKKLYKLLVFYYSNKNHAKAFFEKNIIEIRRKTTYIEVWQEVSF